MRVANFHIYIAATRVPWGTYAGIHGFQPLRQSRGRMRDVSGTDGAPNGLAALAGGPSSPAVACQTGDAPGNNAHSPPRGSVQPGCIQHAQVAESRDFGALSPEHAGYNP